MLTHHCTSYNSHDHRVLWHLRHYWLQFWQLCEFIVYTLCCTSMYIIHTIYMTRGSADVIGDDADTPLHFLLHKQLSHTSMYNISIQTRFLTTRTLLDLQSVKYWSPYKTNQQRALYLKLLMLSKSVRSSRLIYSWDQYNQNQPITTINVIINAIFCCRESSKLLPQKKDLFCTDPVSSGWGRGRGSLELGKV